MSGILQSMFMAVSAPPTIDYLVVAGGAGGGQRIGGGGGAGGLLTGTLTLTKGTTYTATNSSCVSCAFG